MEPCCWDVMIHETVILSDTEFVYVLHLTFLVDLPAEKKARSHTGLNSPKTLNVYCMEPSRNIIDRSKTAKKIPIPGGREGEASSR